MEKIKYKVSQLAKERFWFNEYAKLGIIGLSKSDTEEISASPADNPPQNTSDAPVKTVFASDDNPSDDDAATVIIVK